MSTKPDPPPATTRTCARPECDEVINWSQFACNPDWFALPANLRVEINATWRERQIAVGQGPYERGIAIRAHLDACAAAMHWYAVNPKAPTS